KQKLAELQLLRQGLDKDASADAALAEQRAAIENRNTSSRIHNPAVQERMSKLGEISSQRTPFAERIKLQREALNLPLFPTTTMGSSHKPLKSVPCVVISSVATSTSRPTKQR